MFRFKYQFWLDIDTCRLISYAVLFLGDVLSGFLYFNGVVSDSEGQTGKTVFELV